jgi:hypothetical protein
MPVRQIAMWFILALLTSLRAFPEGNATADRQRATELLKKLLARDTPEEQWSSFEKEFETLPAKIVLPALFPQIAKGFPFGQSYAAYNCSDPLGDRRVPGWGEFCVANWLWCKQLQCPKRRDDVSKVLLELWTHPVSYYGQLVLLEGLCRNREAQPGIATLFRDAAADARLRTEAGVCLLLQDGARYHSEVVAFAEQVPIKFSQPGWNIGLRQRLFDELASLRHRDDSGIDPAVVRMGFRLLLREAEQQRKTKQFGRQVTYYGQFIYADHLNIYLGTRFEPDRKRPTYGGSAGDERFWRDTVVNALAWWSKHQREYSKLL